MDQMLAWALIQKEFMKADRRRSRQSDDDFYHDNAGWPLLQAAWDWLSAMRSPGQCQRPDVHCHNGNARLDHASGSAIA